MPVRKVGPLAAPPSGKRPQRYRGPQAATSGVRADRWFSCAAPASRGGLQAGYGQHRKDGSKRTRRAGQIGWPSHSQKRLRLESRVETACKSVPARQARRASEAGARLAQTQKAAKAARVTARQAAQAANRALRAVIAAAKALAAAATAGGGVVIAVVVVICLCGIILASPLASFLPGLMKRPEPSLPPRQWHRSTANWERRSPVCRRGWI